MTPFEADSPDSLHFQPNIDDWAEEMASSNGLSKDEDPEISESELAQISEAFAHIAKGERTAQALESNLTSLEKKIDELLASFEESEHLKVEEANSKRGNPSGEKNGGDDDKKS